MGNRQGRSAGRHRATVNADGNDTKAKKSSTTSSKQQQQQQPATRPTDVDGGRQLQVSIYRSYSQLGNGPPSRRDNTAAPTLDFKVYRRSARPHVTAANRSMSLPRSFGRTQRLGDQLDASTMPRTRSGDARPIARSSSRASNISTTSTSCKGRSPWPVLNLKVAWLLVTGV